MKGILRRLLTAGTLLVMLLGLYYLGGKYLWSPPDLNTIETVGIIEAPEVNITSRVAGRITELHLLEGDQVESGQIVCRIEDIDIKNQLAKAQGDLANSEADLRDAERTMSRYTKLFAEQAASAKDRDDALTRLERARAVVVADRASVKYYADQLTDTAIRSPVSGLVVSKNLEVGEWVTPGTAILTVDDLSTIWARVNLEETDLPSIHIGQPAIISVQTHPPMILSGRVMAIGQEGQFATERDVRRGRQDIRTFYVKVRVLQASDTLKPGMTAQVSFSLKDGIKAESNSRSRTD